MEDDKDIFKDFNSIGDNDPTLDGLKSKASAANDDLAQKTSALNAFKNDNTYADSFFKNVDEYNASRETPAQAAQRQKNQRRAAMWTAVTDGINHIFNLTQAASNKNAVPMQVTSTSEAVQKAAEKADERYEKNRDRFLALNQQMAQMKAQQNASEYDTLLKSYQAAAENARNTQNAVKEHEGRKFEWLKQKDNQNYQANMEKQRETFQANEKAKDRAHDSAMQNNRLTHQSDENEKNRQHEDKVRSSNLTPAEKEKAAQSETLSSYDSLSPEAKARVDSNMQKFKNQKKKEKKNISDKEYYDELKKCIEQDKRDNGGSEGNGKQNFWNS